MEPTTYGMTLPSTFATAGANEVLPAWVISFHAARHFTLESVVW
ncbi:hypothetical protein [Kribbella sp. NPDC023855]